MTATRFLRPDVHGVAVGEDLVLLDIAADRYVCLPAVGGRATLRPDRQTLEIVDPDLAATLAGAGLLQDAPGPPRRAPPPAPTASAIPADLPRPGWRELPPLLAGLADAAWRYRGRTFAQILAAGARPADRPDPPRFTPELAAAARQFQVWAPYAPVTAQCLLRAFLQLRGLRRAGLDAEWVFGVRTWPFHAHCWLQAEDVVLDDWAERVGAYAPILVV